MVSIAYVISIVVLMGIGAFTFGYIFGREAGCDEIIDELQMHQRRREIK